MSNVKVILCSFDLSVFRIKVGIVLVVPVTDSASHAGGLPGLHKTFGACILDQTGGFPARPNVFLWGSYTGVERGSLSPTQWIFMVLSGRILGISGLVISTLVWNLAFCL